MDNLERKQKRQHGSSFGGMARSLGHGILALSFVLLGTGTASADVVATGDLIALATDGDLSGTNITWDNQDYRPQFFPWSVNLGLEPGINVMEVPPGFGVAGGAVGPYDQPRSGNFFTHFFSDQGDPFSSWNGVLSFFNSFQNGEYVCSNPPYVEGSNCSKDSIFELIDVTFVASELVLSGSFVNVSGGGSGLPTQLGGVPIIYSIDGAQECAEVQPQRIVCGGRINLNAFEGFATEPGGEAGNPNDSVPVPFDTPFIPPGGGPPIPVVGTVTYDQVLEPGFTTLVTSSQAGGSIPPNFRVDVPGFNLIFLDITTTATLPDPTSITVCGFYPDADNNGFVDGTAANECDLRFLHNEGPAPGVFVDRTLAADDPRCLFPQEQTTCDNRCINTVTNEICAGVDSLSTFFIAVETTVEGELVGTLELAIDIVEDLDPAVFENKSLQKNMAKHIGQALRLVDKSKYYDAGDKLEAVLRKTDGCANDGEPDRNDWIQDCDAQDQVYPLLDHAIALVDEILGS